MKKVIFFILMLSPFYLMAQLPFSDWGSPRGGSNMHGTKDTLATILNLRENQVTGSFFMWFRLDTTHGISDSCLGKTPAVSIEYARMNIRGDTLYTNDSSKTWLAIKDSILLPDRTYSVLLEPQFCSKLLLRFRTTDDNTTNISSDRDFNLNWGVEAQ